jgi:hypothetical protein
MIEMPFPHEPEVLEKRLDSSHMQGDHDDDEGKVE